jgi:NADPH-dependent glutamate synthase beta subunit-like oxidoreductase/NAD(P)H-flavin reductase
VDDFIAQLFNIKAEVRTLSNAHAALADLYLCKRLFVQRRALKSYKTDDTIPRDEIESLMAQLCGAEFSELDFATQTLKWLENDHQQNIALAIDYTIWAIHSVAGRNKHKNGVLFKIPDKIHPEQLVPVVTEIVDGVTILRLPGDDLRLRDGFNLTDPGISLEQALAQAHYCIYCHHQGKDSCSSGLKEKDQSFKKNIWDAPLIGCPLEQKISEMNELKAAGHAIGALAVAMIDNPLCAATGHRICNDCMKACIYQKQDPVNIPQIESRTLADILALPFGFEIYSLLTRWNPLNLATPLPKPLTNYKVLVAGLGPAGFTLSHYLLNEGHTVIAVDGLKIEPLRPRLSGVTKSGARIEFQPIYNVEEIFEPLGSRTLAGFGGVAEYGITVRWNKNYLKVIRLLLERRSNFAMYGGVRFGSAITYDSAFALGFDHIALACGSGKPNLLKLDNLLLPGVRTASDFLMALQLTGAAKSDAIANLQIRLPIIVIGGGLTAIDTATEALAYYVTQVEKFLTRYEILPHVKSSWNEEEAIIAEEWISHAVAIRAERELAKQEQRPPNLIKLLKSWGGSRIIYRQKFTASPSYRLNHEEVYLALQEGIEFIEELTPSAIVSDKFGHIAGIKADRSDGETVLIPAKAMLIAAGTMPNTSLHSEDPTNFTLDGKYFTSIDIEGNKVTPEKIAKPTTTHVLMSINCDKQAVSFFGDLHPSYSGNVVKAMASSKKGYPIITEILSQKTPSSYYTASEFISKMNDLLDATIHEVRFLTSNIIEIVIRAPLAAQEFKPGQFYRLQNSCANSSMAMEGIALTGASTDLANGLISLIVLQMGGSSNLCATLKPGEKVVLMGPTGAPTEIVRDQTVILAGGGLGNAVLFSIGDSLRKNGCKVIYFAGYRQLTDRYKTQEIEQAADIIIWCCDEGILPITREGDYSFHGNIIQAMIAYGSARLGPTPLPLKSARRIIAIGSDKMMAAIASARHAELQPYLHPDHLGIASINSPMQCMMKGICAQCLQLHIDPLTGEQHYVYSCATQDQDMEQVSFANLADRLRQNSLQEKMTKEWIAHCLKLSSKN